MNMRCVELTPECDFVMKAAEWQFPPDGELAFDDIAFVTSRKVLSLCHTTLDADECQASLHKMLPGVTSHRGGPMPLVAQTSPDEIRIESELKFQNVSKPFLSLVLPDWVHQKTAEDEAAGTFWLQDLASFPSSPRGSAAGSPMASCNNSPELSTKELSAFKPVDANLWRSGVCWADLAESEESDDDGFVGYNWCAASTASTATSSPATVCTGGVAKDASSEFLVVKQSELDKQQLASGISPMMRCVCPASINTNDFFVIGAYEQEPASAQQVGCKSLHIPEQKGQRIGCPAAGNSQRPFSGVRWTDLVDSDCDPLNYPWSSVETAFSTPA
jgi:hypothetical protein